MINFMKRYQKSDFATKSDAVILQINLGFIRCFFSQEGEFIWSPKVQGYILGSFFFGFIVTQVPAGRLAERYGCKWFLFGSSLTTALLSLLIPPFASVSACAVIVIQALRGLAQVHRPTFFYLFTKLYISQ